MRKSLRTSALCLGLAGLMILSAGCATRNNPGTAATTPATEPTGSIVSEPDKVKLAKAPNGFVSLLNVVKFGKNNFDEAEITWPDTIPLGENPLTYENGIHVVGLEDDDSGISDRFNISLPADKVAALPVFGDIYYTEAEDGSRVMGYTVPYGEDTSRTDNYTYAPLADYEVMTRATPYNESTLVSRDVSYIVFGLTGAWNPLPTRCDITKAGRDGRDYAYAFENGLYYSDILPKYQLEGYPQDASAVDEYAYLENKLGTPSGVAWWTAEPTTIEEFSAMTDKDRKYYIIWDYEDYHIVAVCKDEFDDSSKETQIKAICLVPRVTSEGAQYIEDVSPMSYYGYGKLPALMGGSV